MTITFTAPADETLLKPRITVIGVGGAGGNAVNNMINHHLEGVEFMVANTDAQALQQSFSERRIQLGTSITHGLGAGSRPDMGRAAAEEAIDDLGEQFQGSHMVFIAAGMGGGTGTGAAPVIARLAREQGMLTVGVVTKPFQFEGSNRMRIAEAGIEEMQQFVDTLIVIPNQNLFRIANEKTTFADAFSMADDVLRSGVRGVTDLMVVPGLINLDFADIRAVMSEMGKAMMGTGEADGDDRAKRAAEAAISNPLLDDVSMKGARGVLINITGGPDMTLFEVDEAANRIGDEVDPDANIIFGSALDPNLEGKLRVSVVATGIDVEASVQPRPALKVYTEPALKVVNGIGQQAAPAVSENKAPQVAMAPAHPDGDAAIAVAGPKLGEPDGPAAPSPAPALELGPPHAVAGDGADDAPFMPPPPAEAPRTQHRMAPAEPALDKLKPMGGASGAGGAGGSGGSGGSPVSPAEKPVAERRRGPSLFERMTGGARARREAAETAPARIQEPTMTEKTPEDSEIPASIPTPAPAAPTAAKPAEPAPAPAPARAQVTAPVPQVQAPPPVQDRLDGMDRIERTQAAAQSEEDLLEIPAFLRRQAN